MYMSEGSLRSACQRTVRPRCLLVPGQQLGMRHSAGSVMRRIVKRKLVLQSPGRHGKCQGEEHETSPPVWTQSTQNG